MSDSVTPWTAAHQASLSWTISQTLLKLTFFTVQLSHPYMTTGKTIALTRQVWDHQRIAIQVKLHESPLRAREEEHFCSGKKEVERTMVNRVQGFSWLSPCQETRKSFFFGGSDSGYHHRAWEMPLIISWLFLTEDFILLHFPVLINIFSKTITDQKSDFPFPVSFCSSE